MGYYGHPDRVISKETSMATIPDHRIDYLREEIDYYLSVGDHDVVRGLRRAAQVLGIEVDQ